MNLPFIELSVLISKCVKGLVCVGILKNPSFWQEGVEKHIGLFCIETAGLDNLSHACDSDIAFVVNVFLTAGWVKETSAYEILAQLDLLLDKPSKTEHLNS